MCYGADEIYTRASMRSLVRWKEFGMFHRTGALLTGPREDAHLLAGRDTLARVRYKFEWLEDAELSARFPQLKLDRGTAGGDEPKKGGGVARVAGAGGGEGGGGKAGRGWAWGV